MKNRNILLVTFFGVMLSGYLLCCSAMAGNENGLITGNDLIYKGAFAFPEGDPWTFSGHALAYYPHGDAATDADGFPGSLYAAGSRVEDFVGEISIPAPVITKNFDMLPKANILQSLTDITGGLKDNCSYTDDCIYRELDGLEYLPEIDKLLWNLSDWYNAAGYDQDSLGWCDLDMSGARGVWHIGPRSNGLFHNARTSNYLFKAPEDFADTYLDGKRLIAGNTREAGANGGSQGPTLVALAPGDDGFSLSTGQDLDALSLLYYRENITCVWDPWPDINPVPTQEQCDFPDYRGADHWNGGAWIESGAGSAVLITGRKGIGPNCYGNTGCNDLCSPDDQGYHAYPYKPMILIYDPDDLIKTRAGTIAPWEIVPKEMLDLSNRVFDASCAELGAAAYDPQRNILYVAEQNAGPNGETAVHVWQVRNTASPPAAVLLVSPSGTTTQNPPAYTWNAESNATWYQLYVRQGRSGFVHNQWYASSQVTSGLTCSVMPSVTLNPGEHTWWVRTWNEHGVGPWSSAMTFTVSSQNLPGQAIPVSPSGITPGNTPTYSWHTVSNATWYQLYVREGNFGSVHIKWYTSSQVASGSTCSVTPSVTLNPGDHTWWVRTWNEHGVGPWSSGQQFTVQDQSDAIIIDHTCTDLSKIPETWINQAKAQLRLSYGHTSHGSQPVTGMQVLMGINDMYAINTDGTLLSDTLSLDDYTPGGDLGQYGDVSWADRTRAYLNSSGTDRNVVIWSWCGGVSDNDESGINAYLTAMNQLESDFPWVTFVYMTGHLDGTGSQGNLHLRNNQIRNYCKTNNKVLFDFADIESYDPDGNGYLDLGGDDGCNYNSGAGNWARQWCSANPDSLLCDHCGYDGCCAHSEPLNCNLKARAFWWMLARITGWQGPD